jgi:hypothetical protein
VLGSPAAWISASGVPAAGGIDARLRMGSTSFADGGWRRWRNFGGKFLAADGRAGMRFLVGGG